MPDRISKSTKTTKKKVSVSAAQLAETYNKLLEEYVDLLKAEPINPYEFSIKQRILEWDCEYVLKIKP